VGSDRVLVISCEHGGHTIPAPYRALFESQRDKLITHCSLDLGALGVARRMATHFQASLFAAVTSRLLVDLNRTIGHPRLFSAITRSLPAEEKRRILKRHYVPHRVAIEDTVRRHIDAGQTVVHIACHSFTPVLDGRVRSMDVGLLYDPARRQEHRLCAAWKKALADHDPALTVRRNSPYKGISDGLATHFRKIFAPSYLGIELEMNQQHLDNKLRWRELTDAVVASLQIALQRRNGRNA